MTLGSPGGSDIINYVGKVLIGTLDWGLDVQAAITLPNVGSRNGPTELEAGRVEPRLGAALVGPRARDPLRRTRPRACRPSNERPTGWFAGADPRREGTARGRGDVTQ